MDGLLQTKPCFKELRPRTSPSSNQHPPLYRLPSQSRLPSRPQSAYRAKRKEKKKKKPRPLSSRFLRTSKVEDRPEWNTGCHSGTWSRSARNVRSKPLKKSNSTANIEKSALGGEVWNLEAFELQNGIAGRTFPQKHEFVINSNTARKSKKKLKRGCSMKQMNRLLGLESQKVKCSVVKKKKEKEEIIILKQEKKRTKSLKSEAMLKIEKVNTFEKKRGRKIKRKSRKSKLQTFSIQTWMALLEAKRFNQDNVLVSSITTQSVKVNETRFQSMSPNAEEIITQPTEFKITIRKKKHNKKSLGIRKSGQFCSTSSYSSSIHKSKSVSNLTTPRFSKLNSSRSRGGINSSRSMIGMSSRSLTPERIPPSFESCSEPASSLILRCPEPPHNFGNNSPPPYIKHNLNHQNKDKQTQKLLTVIQKKPIALSADQIAQGQRKKFSTKFGLHRFNTLLKSFQNLQLIKHRNIDIKEARMAYKYLFPRQKKKTLLEDVKLFMRLQSSTKSAVINLPNFLSMWIKYKNTAIDKFLQLAIR